MNPTALIAEDEPLLAQALRAELATCWPALQVVAVVGDGTSAHARALAERPTVLFLDIRMPGMTGLEAAQALAEDWPAGVPFPLVVFVTAYDQYAVQAFEAQAVDYLVKPVEPVRLAACVGRLQRRLAERAAFAPAVVEGDRPVGEAAAPQAMEQAVEQAVERVVHQLRVLGAVPALAGPAPPVPPVPPPARLEVIQAQVGAVVRLVPVDDVVYFEAADKYVRVLTASQEHLIRTPLKELLPQLDPQRFWQVHRGTIVNVRCIASARRDDSGKVYLTLCGRDETLVASRLYAHLFKGM